MEISTKSSKSFKIDSKLYIVFLRSPQLVEIWRGGEKVQIDIPELNPDNKEQIDWDMPKEEIKELFKKNKNKTKNK